MVWTSRTLPNLVDERRKAVRFCDHERGLDGCSDASRAEEQLARHKISKKIHSLRASLCSNEPAEITLCLCGGTVFARLVSQLTVNVPLVRIPVVRQRRKQCPSNLPCHLPVSLTEPQGINSVSSLLR